MALLHSWALPNTVNQSLWTYFHSVPSLICPFPPLYHCSCCSFHLNLSCFKPPRYACWNSSTKSQVPIPSPLGGLHETLPWNTSSIHWPSWVNTYAPVLILFLPVTVHPRPSILHVFPLIGCRFFRCGKHVTMIRTFRDMLAFSDTRTQFDVWEQWFSLTRSYGVPKSLEF